MAQKAARFSIALPCCIALVGATTGCLKTTHSLDGDLQIKGPTGAWGIPLAQVAVSTDDLPPHFAESVTSHGPGAPFIWHQTLAPQTVSAGGWLQWQDPVCEVTEALSLESLAVLNALPNGGHFDVEVAESIALDGFGGHEVRRLQIAGGTLRCTPHALPGAAIGAYVTLHQLYKDGAPISFQVSGAPTEVDLAGTVLLLPPDQPRLDVSASVSIMRTADPVGAKAVLGWTLDWEGLDVALFEGRLAAMPPLVVAGQQDLDLPGWLAGGVGLADPSVQFSVVNEQGVGFDLDLSGQIHSPSPSPLHWTPTTQVPAAPVPGTPSSSLLVLDNATTSPPLSTWLSSGATGIDYEVALSVADPGEDVQFVQSTGGLTIQPEIEVPFIGFAGRIAFRDTVPCDLEAALSSALPPGLARSAIERLTLRFHTANMLPFGLALQAAFLDAGGAPIDSLFLEAATILEPATTEPSGAFDVPTAPGIRTWDLVFEGAAADELVQAGVGSLAIELTGCTPGAVAERPVAFGPGMELSVHLALRVDVNPFQP